MDFKTEYLLAKKNGKTEKFRSDKISNLICEVVPLSDQIAILMDKETKPIKFAKYQEIRNFAKKTIDAKIEDIEKSLVSTD